MSTATRKTIIPLDTFADIKTALTLGPVYCDITSPPANRIPVRDVRRFKASSLDKLAAQSSQTEWTTRFSQGQAKSYEVLVLEGWHVPERVYRETAQ